MENLAYIDPPRTERIEGETYRMIPPPRIKNVLVAGNIYIAFERHLTGTSYKAISSKSLVYLDDDNIYDPDAMICERSKIHRDGIYGAPDLVVEVLSPSTRKHDRGAKMRHYAAAGVREYWIVDPLAESVEVYKNHGGIFELDEIYEDYNAEDRAQMTEKELADIHTDIPVALQEGEEGFTVRLQEIFEDTTFE
ncbi:Uma2 family endonuclease [uncultured Selenomonas sp.]|uniref:Uma2 family endonuclease n=1 Tax=uncultured Selenomonas sp. TaxID=159275 RepID=UPI0025D5A6A0|nr:Uma2 family endonuclease [uncultured Selenomonas sp.]